MNKQEKADKEIEIFAWLTKRGYDRKASKDIAPIIVNYLAERLSDGHNEICKEITRLQEKYDENGYDCSPMIKLQRIEKHVDLAIDNAKLLSDGWVKVEDTPLFTIDDKGRWETTDDGNGEFLAAVPYTDKKGVERWWIRHCIFEDGVGLCVVGDDENEPAGWEMTDIAFWQPLPKQPTE